MDAEAAQTRANVAINSTSSTISIADFQSKTTLSVAMGVSSGIATDAHAGLTDIQREIAAIESYRKTAEDAYNNLKSEAERLEMEAQDLQTQVDAARDAHFDLNTEAIDLEGAASSLRIQLNFEFGDDITTAETTAVEQDGFAEVDDTEADRLEGLDPTDPNIAIKREEAEQHRKTAADERAKAAAIRKDPDYIALKRDTDEAEAKATAKRGLADAKAMERTDLQTKADETQMKARETAEDADKAKAHLDAIAEIKADLETQLTGLKGVVGDDATAAESEKAQLVFALLRKNHDVPSSDVVDLDTADYVFARADKPAGTATFEQIANANAAWVFHRRSIVNDNNTPNNRNDDTINTEFVPANHPAINLSNFKVTDFVKQDGSNPSYPVGSSQAYLRFDHGKLNGIEGTLYCDSSSGCSTSSNGFFGGGWYFTPAVNSGREGSLGYNPAEASFEDFDGDGTYEVVSYVDYGMWLAGADDALELHYRAGVRGPQESTSTLDFTTTSGNTDTSATYSGDAHGLSALTTGSVTASGHFEADVELRATFGASPMLGGTIDNFRPVAGQGSSHVDTDWSLTLNPALLNSNSFGRSSSQIPYTTNNGGSWNAEPYGDTRNERPDGFYGRFSATFRNDEGTTIGAAVGVYSAEKE